MRTVYLLIPLVLVFGVYVTYQPHLNYNYPLNIDEWEHFTMAEETTIIGHTPTYFSAYKDYPDAGTMRWERNYHTMLSVFFLALPFPHEFTMTLVPSLVSVVLMLSSFILIKYLTKSDFAGVAAAALVVTMKSNITLMGPWFAVPSAAGLAVSPLVFYLFLRAVEGNKWSMVFAGAVFASTALMTPHIIILLPVMALYLLVRPRRILKIWKELVFAAVVLAGLFIVFVPSVLTDPLGAISQFRQYSYFGQEDVEIKFNVLNYVGYVPFLFSILGIFLSLRKTEDEHMILSCFFGLLLILIYIYNEYDIMFLTMYRRVFLFLVEALYLMAAFGLYGVYNFLNKRFEKISYLAFVILFSAMIYGPSTTVDFYSGLLKHYITDEDYTNILWMRDNLQDGAVVLATPEASTAIPPIAHRFIANYAFSPIQDLDRLLQYPCSFEGLRAQYGITHVYKPGTVCSGITLLGAETYSYN